MIVWPISGAAPVAPRNVRPPMTMPPPTPVPTVNITTMSAIGRMSSSWASASAASVASLSTKAGIPRRSVSSVRSGTPCNGMFTDERAVPVSKSMTDGQPDADRVGRARGLDRVDELLDERVRARQVGRAQLGVGQRPVLEDGDGDLRPADVDADQPLAHAVADTTVRAGRRRAGRGQGGRAHDHASPHLPRP